MRARYVTSELPARKERLLVIWRLRIFHCHFEIALRSQRLSKAAILEQDALIPEWLDAECQIPNLKFLPVAFDS